MPKLTFAVTSAKAVADAATPMIALELRIDSDERVQAILLRAQVRIDAQRRTYTPAESARLADLFGDEAMHARTLRSLLWANVTMSIPPFVDTRTVAVTLPCTLDMQVASAKLLHALDESSVVPLTLLFSGTVFHGAPLSIMQIPWANEASWDLPASVLRAAFPNGAYVPLRHEIFDRLASYKTAIKAPTFDETILALLEKAQS